MSYVCGIAGGSGSGKSTLCQAIRDAIGPHNVAVLSYDAYYFDAAHLPLAERGRRNYDHPDSLDTDLFVAHLDLLRAGRAVEVPQYDFATHTRRGSFVVEPVPVLLTEGILLFSDPEIVEAIDHRVFLDCDTETRRKRRTERDQLERGRAIHEIDRQWEQFVEPMFSEFVEPARRHAHRVIDSSVPLNPTAGPVFELVEHLRSHR